MRARSLRHRLMSRLVLIRHAKSSWVTQKGDKERPLDERGVQQTSLIGSTLTRLGLTGPRVLCSAAARTRETWERVSAACPDAQVEIRDDLYLASSQAYIAAIDEREGDTILIGHNPTCAELLTIWGEGDGKYPTGSVAVFERGDPPRLVSFASPRTMAANA